jgi:hypothetical protein
MKISHSSSLPDVAFIVCSALDKAGIVAVLTGGSAATVYAPHAYQSHDLDFIVQFRTPGSNANDILESLGYSLKVDHYVHGENPLLLEFPSGPLAVGRDLIKKWDTLRRENYLLHIINPTDSCRDRLSGFLFWNDRGSLEQAVAVAAADEQRVDLDAIRTWCSNENCQDQFSEFERLLGMHRQS